jgi:hypothetical protein
VRAVIGQVNMQETGTETTQKASEVLDFAWFIGEHIAEIGLTLPVHAFFVSSRKAKSDPQMTSLCYAFRVAMAGRITPEDAKNLASVHCRVTIAKTNVTHIIKYLCTLDIDVKYELTYVEANDMSSLVPRGVFAGW